MKPTTILSTLAIIGFVCSTAANATAKEENREQSNLVAQAKISRAVAQRTALAKAPGGSVKEAELEEEDGTLVWSFDITTPGTEDITEVLVDAKTGAVVSVEVETPEDEAGEHDHGEDHDHHEDHEDDDDHDDDE